MCSGRGDRIRTCDIYVPNVALYQSELHPESPLDLSGAAIVAGQRRGCLIGLVNIALNYYYSAAKLGGCRKTTVNNRNFNEPGVDRNALRSPISRSNRRLLAKSHLSWTR